MFQDIDNLEEFLISPPNKHHPVGLVMTTTITTIATHLTI